MKKLFVVIALMIFLTIENYAQETECKLLAKIAPGKVKIEEKGKLLILKRESEYGNSISVRVSENLIEKTLSSKCEILQMELSADFEGDKTTPTDKIELSFDSISNKFLYDSATDRKIIFRVDGNEVFSMELEQRARNDLSEKIKREYLSTDKNIAFAELKKLAEAKSVTLQIGKKTFNFSSQQQQAFKDFYNELNKTKMAVAGK